MVYKTAADSLADPLPAGSPPGRGSGARVEAPFWSSLGLSRGWGYGREPKATGQEAGTWPIDNVRPNQCYLPRPCLARH